MALTDEEREVRRTLLREANVTDRYVGRPLSTMGNSGIQLREFMKDELQQSDRERYGVTFVSDQVGLAQSFTRDIVIAKAGARFYYLNNFINAVNREDGLPNAYVLEWFEQADMPIPYSPKERFVIETRIMGLMDTGIIFHLFTGVAPSKSEWWSRSFMHRIAETNKTIIGTPDGDRKRGAATAKLDTKEQRQKSFAASKRVAVR